MLTLTQQRAVALIFIVSLLTIIGAWLFQFAGYAPCRLCLMQRWAWYAAIVLSGIFLAMPAWRRAGLWLLALIMFASGVFGAWHAGVEWKFWPGPTTCEGTLGGGLPQLGNTPVIGCEDAAIRILGISLAGWNAILSFALAAVAFIAARRPSAT